MFIINLIAFDIAWFGLVYWGNLFIPFALLMLCLHFYFVSKNRIKELYLISTVTLIGVLVDSILQYFGVFTFPEGQVMPLWLITLWFCFASTICHSLKFLQKSKLFQVLVGGLLAPVSYLAGNEMNAVSFGLSVTNTFVILSVLWGVLMLIFFALKSQLIQEEARYA